MVHQTKKREQKKETAKTNHLGIFSLSLFFPSLAQTIQSDTKKQKRKQRKNSSLFFFQNEQRIKQKGTVRVGAASRMRHRRTGQVARTRQTSQRHRPWRTRHRLRHTNRARAPRGRR